MSTFVRKYQVALVIFIAFVFVQSLFFKFINSPETIHIFGMLDAWAESLGAPGLFARTGPFSQYVIGTAELVASVMLLASLVPSWRGIRPFGALLAPGVITGATLFHLFTTLGISVTNADGTPDGGLLFAMACGVWISAATLIIINRDDRLPPIGRLFGSRRDVRTGHAA